MQRNDAKAALGNIADAQADLAKALECPPWRHALFGLIMGMLVLSGGLPLPWSMLLLAIAMCLMVLTFLSDRRRAGVFANGYRSGPTRPVAFAILGVTLVLLVAEIHAREAGLSMLTRYGLAIIEFVLAIWASVEWQRRFSREMSARG